MNYVSHATLSNIDRTGIEILESCKCHVIPPCDTRCFIAFSVHGRNVYSYDRIRYAISMTQALSVIAVISVSKQIKKKKKNDESLIRF